jgi:23S rRNA (cytidine1920-2'-O)/16S rRNA (cytidine1409-2'-O)-methyltransferase
VRGLTASPLKGPAGNREFLAWLQPGPSTSDLEPLIDQAVAEAHAL